MAKYFLLCLIAIAILAHLSLSLPNKGAKRCPANEFWTDCGDACQTECATLGKPCNISWFICPSGCYCNKGYARDAKKRCIPNKKCKKGPGPKKCPKNEFYTTCGDNCQTECSTLGKPCEIIYKKCPEGCYCNKGFARDCCGKYIPIEQCNE